MKSKIITFMFESQYNIIYSPIILLFLLTIILLSCSDNQSSKQKNITEIYGKKVNYPNQPGDESLFSEEKPLSLSQKLKKIKNDTDIQNNSNAEFEDNSEHKKPNYSKNKEKKEKKHKKEKHWKKLAFETEPEISASLLRNLTTCPVPKLNLTKPTITSNVEWQIFVYCVLDILPEKDDGDHIKHEKKSNNDDADIEGLEYPEITEMRKYQDAYKFLKKSLKKFLKIQLFANPSISNEQKFALFERIFLVTKFRLLTQNEKSMVEDLIASKGLYYTTIIYRLNWYFSQFYQDHFDFSQDPQPEYESYRMYGKIIDEDSGELINGAKFSIPGQFLYGFHTFGESSLDNSTQFNGNNLFIQFYVPENKNTITTDIQIPVFVEKEGYEHQLAMFPVEDEITTGIQIVLRKQITEPQPPDSTPTWPDVDTTANPNLESLNWSILSPGSLRNCKIPELITDVNITIVNGYEWQDFLKCHLNVNITELPGGYDYFGLVSKRSAFDLMFLIKDQFITSDKAIVLSDTEIAGAVYEAVTFREADQYTLNMIEASINETSLNNTLKSLLEIWYHSSTYNNNFDFSKYVLSAMIEHTISGALTDSEQNTLGNVSIKLQDSKEEVISETISDESGRYSLTVRLNDFTSSKLFHLKLHLEGYGDRTVSIHIDNNQKSHIQNISLNPIGSVTKDIGGQILSPTKEITVTIPENAVTESINFAITDMTVSDDPDNSDSNQAIFYINPGYQFNSDVSIEIKLSDTFLSNSSPNDNFIVFAKQSDSADWILLPSKYHSLNKSIIVTTSHFSSFKITKDRPGSSHSIATVLANESWNFEFPSALPTVLSNAKSILDQGRWDSSVIDRITLDEDLGLSQDCLKNSCNSMKKYLDPQNILDDYQVSNPFANAFIGSKIKKVSIDSAFIQGTSTMTGSANLNVHAEHCSNNPTATQPKLKLNRVNGTRIDYNLILQFNNVKIDYDCSGWESRTARYWFFGWRYYTYKVWIFKECTTGYFNHTATILINDRNENFFRDHFNNWNETLLYDGDPKVTFSSAARSSNVRREYSDRVEIEILKQINDNIRNGFLDKLNNVKSKDPDFYNTDQCVPPVPPEVYILSNQHQFIGTHGEFTSTHIYWGSNKDGDYKVIAGNSCDSGKILSSGQIEPYKFITSTINADDLPIIGENTIQFCVTRPNGLNMTNTGRNFYTITRDETVPLITTQSGFNRYLSNSGYSETDLTWKSDTAGTYYIKVNEQCKTSPLSLGSIESGSISGETYISSVIPANQLVPGENSINLCVRYPLTGSIGEASYSFTLDETPPTSSASPNLEGGIFAEAQTVTINCTDNYGCSEIAYTTNGADPDFISNGLVIPSDSVSISIGSEFDGLHTVKFVSRDKAGNIENNINTLTFSVYSTIPEVTAKVDHNFVSASGGYPQSTIEWTTNVDGFYEVKYKGNCETGEIIAGANTNGNVNLDVPIFTVIDADQLIQGTNTLYICVENLAGLKGSGAVAITLDNDAPTLTIEPPPRDDYNTAQIVTIGCTEQDCEKIIYTTDNSEPAFDSNGEISNGILYAASIVPPDQAKTVIKYSAIDYAGNVSPVQTASYTIDTITPEINIVSGLTSLSIGDGIESTELIWNTTRSGLEYSVRIGGTDCQSGQTSLDNGRSGTTAAGDISTTILAEELELGESTIRICVANLIGHYGSETHTITRVENPPSLTLHSIDRKFLSLNPGFDLSNISWESNQSGDFAFKFKGNCETGETLPGATNSGTINASEKMLSVINANDINTEGTHAIFICVTNKNNMSSELVDIIFLDKTPPATSVTPRGGVFAKAKEVTLECTDNNECDSIVYTLDGTLPEFYDTGSGNGTEVNGIKVVMTIGSGSNGIYPLIFKSRDTVQNVESLNSINFYIDNTVPDVTINSLDHRYVSNNGYVSATIIWQSDRDGSYSVKVSGDCTLGTESTGLNPSGAVQAGTPIDSEILAGDLFPGRNTIRICVTSVGKTAEQTETITLDDTAPLVFANPGEGAYGTEQEVTISCSDNCLKIAYTEDGTDPQFDVSGNITNGIEYTASWLTPNWQSIMLKYRAFDLAGNVSPIQSSNYIIDDRYPTVSLVLKQRDYVSINSTFNSSDLIWNVDYKDLDYAVKIGGTGCTDGALSSGSGGSGKTVAGNIVSSVLATDLAPNEYNEVRICAKNLIPNDGEYDGYTTVWIKRHDEEPNLIVGEPQYSTLSSKGYDQTLLVWTSDLDGDYIIKINGDDCDSGTTSSGAGSVGQVYSGNSISTTIKEADLDPGVNTIRICVNGRNGLQKSAVLSITKDETGPTITVLNEGSLKVHLSNNGRSSSILYWNSDSTGIYSIRKGSNCLTGDLAIAANSSGPLPTDLSPIENTIYANDLSDLAPGIETNILICVIKESNGSTNSKPISFYRDDNAPQVVTWIPTGTEVKLDSQIMVDFDKELDPASITLASIELSNSLAGIISGTYSYASNRIIFIPSGLDSNKDYIFTVYSGVTDLYGNHLSQHQWSFHTEISNLWRKAIWSKSIWTIP